MSVEYHFSRYYSPYMEHVKSLEEALARAGYDIEYNEAYPVKIVCEDGTVLDHDTIFEQTKPKDEEE